MSFTFIEVLHIFKVRSFKEKKQLTLLTQSNLTGTTSPLKAADMIRYNLEPSE